MTTNDDPWATANRTFDEEVHPARKSLDAAIARKADAEEIERLADEYSKKHRMWWAEVQRVIKEMKTE